MLIHRERSIQQSFVLLRVHLGAFKTAYSEGSVVESVKGVSFGALRTKHRSFCRGSLFASEIDQLGTAPMAIPSLYEDFEVPGYINFPKEYATSIALDE